MVLAESATRLAASLLAIARNRVDLVATELEEESLRYFSYLAMSLAALFCIGMAVLLGVALIVVLYWETHRIEVLLGLMAAFALAGVLMGIRVRRQYQEKPRLLAHTRDELARDNDLLRPSA